MAGNWGGIPSDQVVAVVADLDTGLVQIGSGYLVTERQVLTARHCTADKSTGRPPRSLRVVRRSDGAEAPATVIAAASDVAVLAVGDGLGWAGVTPLEPPRFGRVDRSRAGELRDCEAVGFPLWQLDPMDQQRNAAELHGTIRVTEGAESGLLVMRDPLLNDVTAPGPAAAGRADGSPWGGLSGALVFHHGVALGVVIEHHPRQGRSAITIMPVERFAAVPAGGDPDSMPVAAALGLPPAARLPQAGAGVADVLPALPGHRHESAYRSTVREIHIRNGPLRGRERELDELAAFAQGHEGYRWLVGKPFAGKTALLAEFVTTRLPGQVDVVSYFLSRREGDADSNKFLAEVVPQLAGIRGVGAPDANRHQFNSLWQQAAQNAVTRDRHLLLVVDGLDEDLTPKGSPSVAALLPSAVAGLHDPTWRRAHVLVSSRLDFTLPQDILPGHPLRAAARTLEPYAQSSAYAALAEREIDSLKAIEPDARPFLAALAAAAGPLSIEDLQELTGLSHERLDALAQKAHRSLQVIGPATAPRYYFGHDSLLDKARADADLRVLDYRELIHGWADSWRRRRWQHDQEARVDVPRYLLDAYLGTLNDEPERLAALASDVGWVTSAIEQTAIDLVLANLRTCVAAVPDSDGPAAMLATIRGQAPHLRSQPVLEPGHVLRQLCLQAEELQETSLASAFRERLSAYPGLVPQWTSRRSDRALVAEVNGQAGWVNAVAVARGGRVVCGADDGWISIWDPEAPATGSVRLGRHDGPVRALAVHRDGRVVSGGHDHRIRVWDPASLGAAPVELGRHDGAVRALAIHENGWVISGGDDARVLVWDEHALAASPMELGRHAGVVRSVAVAPDGRVVSGGDDHRVRLWDLAAPGDIAAQTNRLGGRIMTVAVAPDLSVVLAGTDSVLYRWYHQFSNAPVDSGLAPIRSGSLPAEFGSHHGVVRAVSIVSDGMAVSGGDDGRILMWQWRNRRVRQVELGRHDGPVRAVAVSSDDRLVSGGQDQRVRVWDLRAPLHAVADSRIPSGAAYAVSISPDGNVVSGGSDKRVWLWDAAQQTGPVELGRHDTIVVSVAALADGRVVSGEADGHLRLWDRARPGQAASVLGRHDGAILAAVPGCRVISGGYDRRVLLWDAVRRTRPVELGRHHSPVAAVAALIDGRVVTGGTAGDVRIWDPDSPGVPAPEMERYQGRLNALAALPGRVVGGGDDGRVWIWDLVSGKVVASFSGHDSWLTSLTALPSGHLISSGTDGRLSVWAPEGQNLRLLSVVACSVRALSAGQTREGNGCLAIAHADTGVSYWTLSVPE